MAATVEVIKALKDAIMASDHRGDWEPGARFGSKSWRIQTPGDEWVYVWAQGTKLVKAGHYYYVRVGQSGQAAAFGDAAKAVAQAELIAGKVPVA